MEPATVMSKVYNLTDISTPTLVQYGLVGQSIIVGTRLVAPGEFVEQPKSPSLMSTLKHLLTVGAVSVDMIPPPYTKARQQQAAALGGKPSNAPAHLQMNETKITDPGPPQPPPAAPAPAVVPPPVVETMPSPPPPPEEPKANSKRGK